MATKRRRSRKPLRARGLAARTPPTNCAFDLQGLMEEAQELERIKILGDRPGFDKVLRDYREQHARVQQFYDEFVTTCVRTKTK